MPCFTGKAQQQYSQVSQPWQLKGRTQSREESLLQLNGPRLWWSSKMQPSTPRNANAEAVSMRPNHRQRSKRCTIPHWDGSNWLNSSWFGVWDRTRCRTMRKHCGIHMLWFVLLIFLLSLKQCLIMKTEALGWTRYHRRVQVDMPPLAAANSIWNNEVIWVITSIVSFMYTVPLQSTCVLR